MKFSKEELAEIIDSTAVKATATRGEIENLCREALQHGFGCVCVNPYYVNLAAKLLETSNVKVCSTIGFPFGSTLTEVKALEAVKAVENGAEELDMVINLGALKSGDSAAVTRDILAVVDAKRFFKDLIVKVIIEADYLTDYEKITACRLAEEAGADFVKTSTGFFGKGAAIEDVRLMRRTVGREIGVKAAGGIRTFADAVAMIKAGANRIGTSTAAAIIGEAP